MIKLEQEEKDALLKLNKIAKLPKTKETQVAINRAFKVLELARQIYVINIQKKTIRYNIAYPKFSPGGIINSSANESILRNHPHSQDHSMEAIITSGEFARLRK